MKRHVLAYWIDGHCYVFRFPKERWQEASRATLAWLRDPDVPLDHEGAFALNRRLHEDLPSILEPKNNCLALGGHLIRGWVLGAAFVGTIDIVRSVWNAI